VGARRNARVADALEEQATPSSGHNMKRKALGLTIPPTLLVVASEVIE
jgi:hypothetical protein